MPRDKVSAERVASDVRVTFGRLRRRLQEIGDGELSPSQASALARVGKLDVATASALATAEGIRPQSMATILASLEELGLVTRSPDPTDGRRQLVTLTAAGRARERGARSSREEWLFGAIRERLTDAERGTVLQAMALLERVIAE